MKVENTLIVIGKGREAIDAFFRNGEPINFSLILPVPPEAYIYGLEQWRKKYWGCTEGVTKDYTDHHRKRVVTFVTDTPPVGITSALILRFPHLRFVHHFDDGTIRGQIEGRGGRVTKEVVRDDRPIWTRDKDGKA